ncbi:MAG: IS5 family transposase [Nanoarchaeota archaeon]|nr:IS5 family transposase [Nanoarchaeota archaeon]
MIIQKEATDKYTKEGYLYFSFDFLEDWEKELGQLNKQKKGRKFQFPNSMIKCCSKIKFAFQTGWRQVSGILSCLKKWIPIPEVPKKSQISERFNELKFDYQESIIKEKSQNVAVDSTGIKLRFSGQWKREKHKIKSPFLKLHVAVNTKTNQAVAKSLTEDSISDGSQARKLLIESNKISKVKKSFMDGAYDYKKIWKWCLKNNIEPFIRLRKDAKPHGLDYRSQQAKWMHKIGHDSWMKERGMGEREPAECWNSSYKRRFGEFFCCRNLKSMEQEINFKIMMCNELIIN